ncbi:hypothetical protein [Candidatus Williamhamiltonella defendens]|uniref:hypothetical protein n=1 Tax=Candidatus Williamhamiltonella defendens TaxID=138072 RepID=UPI002A4E202F|nr:hypothetical protein [Candidatus Hamiltonella defensa]
MAVREALNQAIEREQTLSPDDALFLALQRVKTEVNRDMATRLAQVDKTVLRTPETVLPALVLAAQWYDNASRERDITSRNRVPHPGLSLSSHYASLSDDGCGDIARQRA